MPESCKECQQKQQRIDQLEAMIKRMSESFDAYLDRQEYERSEEIFARKSDLLQEDKTASHG